MPHIHTQPGQVDATVTAFIVRLDRKSPEILFHVHKKYQRLLPVGGHIELDETPWAAVAHEIEEESGYELAQLSVMQPKLRLGLLTGVVSHPVPLRLNTHEAAPGHFHSDTAFLFVTHEDPLRHVAEHESADLRWLTRANLDSITDKEMYVDARETAVFILDKLLDEWEPVPTGLFSADRPS